MHRFAFQGSLDSQPATSPDTTVLEAAEAMERLHSSRLMVGSGGALPIGVLTAEDIMNKVLAAGQDPTRVRVADIMSAGRMDRHGAFLVDDEPFLSSIRGAETLHSRDDDDNQVLLQVISGKCEECGVYNEELVDHEGLEMCSDCAGFRTALFT
jgi:hypothetical protein